MSRLKKEQKKNLLKNKKIKKTESIKSESIKTESIKSESIKSESIKSESPNNIQAGKTDNKINYSHDLSWKIIESYYKDKHLSRLVQHQIDSYNYFVQHQIKETINMFNPVLIHSEHDKDLKTGLYSLEIIISFKNFQMHRPQIHENNGATKIMFPHEARLRNFTYSSNMNFDIDIKILKRSGENLSQIETLHKSILRINFGKLPIMLKSSICVLTQQSHLAAELTGECKYDAGGYFIINGSEKTCIAQERAAENTIMCFNIKKNNNKWGWLAEIKSIPDFKCISPKQINILISARNNGSGHSIHVQIPRIKNPVPLFIVFRALGIISDKEICEKILLDIDDDRVKSMMFALKASIIDAQEQKDEESALQIIILQAMFTPINMEKEAGIKKKENLP